ncbi:helix-turn-helix domain-containing protein [Absicoccus porci]|uniref:helix-turn-helix domain-containing protein n=1 Tax=Absicoccus porci TaxID=2486576 RepID=UPI001FE2F829|nr:helix-turn-helix transcriptional regulator [Absicoccus porci]
MPDKNIIDMELYASIGKQLKAARKSKGISLDTLSDLIGGIKTKSTLKRYEDGTSRIEVDTLKIICDQIGLNYLNVISKARESLNKKSQWGDDAANREYLADKPELLDIYNQIVNRDDMVILFNKTKDLDPKDVESVLMFVQTIRKQRGLDD